MSNISSIKVSGVTYSIKDNSAPKVVELTQAQYDALQTKDPNTFYVITDAQGADLSNYWTSAQTQSAITESVSGKVDTSTFETYSGSVETALSGKQDTLSAGTGIDITNDVISVTGGSSITIDPTLDSGSTNPVANSAITTALSGKQETLVSGTNIKTINNLSLLGSGNIDIQGGGGGKAIEAGRGISITTGQTADTVSISLPIISGAGDYSIIGNGIIGGIINSTLGLGATAFGIGNSAETRASFVIGAGCKASGDYSFAGGDSSRASGNTSFAFGYMAQAKGDYSIAFGSYFPLTNNESEVALGKANVSHTGSTDADRTLFSVGNGTNTSNRHNALEIRQNGDIYITSGASDIKLQDALGGGSITIDPTLDSGSTNPVANSAITTALSGKVDASDVTSAITSGSTDVVTSGGVYEQLGGMKIVKLTESQYTALVTKDESTLYVVVPDPSN